MTEPYIVLTQKDAGRVSRAVRKIEQGSGIYPFHRRNPRVRGVGSGGAAAVTLLAKIIEAPTYADPTQPVESELHNGRSWYTVRLTSTSRTVWAPDTDYEVNDIVAYPTADSPSYRCKVDHRSNPDILPTNTAYWEKLEDIRIEYAFGFEDPPRDLRQCCTWFGVGEVVELISRTVDSNTRYYIKGPIFWCGEDEAATIRQFANSSESYPRSVFM